MGTMAIPDHTGHREVRWSGTDPISIQRAAEAFGDLAQQRMVPFARTGLDDFHQVRAFDPSADEILWVRPLQGG